MMTEASAHADDDAVTTMSDHEKDEAVRRHTDISYNDFNNTDAETTYEDNAKTSATKQLKKKKKKSAKKVKKDKAADAAAGNAKKKKKKQKKSKVRDNNKYERSASMDDSNRSVAAMMEESAESNTPRHESIIRLNKFERSTVSMLSMDDSIRSEVALLKESAESDTRTLENSMPLKMPVRRNFKLIDNLSFPNDNDDNIDNIDDDDDATLKTSGQSNKRSNSTGTYDEHVQLQFLEKRDSEKAARRASSVASGPGSGSQSPRAARPKRPMRTRRGSGETRYKSNSLGALDNKRHAFWRKKESIRILGPGSRGSSRSNGRSIDRRYNSSSHSDDDDDQVQSRNIDSCASDTESTEGTIPLEGGSDESSALRTRGSGGPKFRSQSAGGVDKNTRDMFLQKKSDDENTASDGQDQDGRPLRVRRGSNQQRFRSNSAGALLDNKRRETINDSSFLKPRKRSGAALKAKETVERSMQESSLHQAQPNIRVALPRLRSTGALNARGSSSRRSSRDRSFQREHSHNDDENDDEGERMVQSERALRTALAAAIKDDDDDGGDYDESSSSDGSAESEVIVDTSTPLPKSFRSSRNWADASKQLDQLPSITRSTSVMSLPDQTFKKAEAGEVVALAPASADVSLVGDEEVWMESLNDAGHFKVDESNKNGKVQQNNSSMDTSAEDVSDNRAHQKGKKSTR